MVAKGGSDSGGAEGEIRGGHVDCRERGEMKGVELSWLRLCLVA